MKTFLSRSVLATLTLLGIGGTAQALPDLIIGNVQYDRPHYSAGDTATFSVFIWNDGESEDIDIITAPVRFSISIGTDPVVSYEFDAGIPVLLVGEENGMTFEADFPIPADLSPGIYPVTVHVDPPVYGNIWEGLEGEENNTFSGLFLRVDYDPQDKPVVEFVNPDNPNQAFPFVDGCYEATIPAFVGSPYQVRVRTSDTDGYVRSVEFFADGIRLGEPDRTAPYEASWTPEGVGVFEFGALVTDNHGNQGYACLTVVVTEDEPEIPTVTLLSPPDGGSYLPGTVLPLLAAPSDPDGIVQSVQFLVNGVAFDEPVGAPFQGSFTIPSQGTFNLTAIATDNEGNQSRPSNTRTVRGGAPDPEMPLVIIESPLPQGAGDTVNDASVGSSMFISARVVPPQVSGASIDRVVFYINGVAIGSDSEPYNGVYSLMYRAASTGVYSIYAEAVASVPDTGETRGVSAPILLQVVNLESPYPTVDIQAVPDNDPNAAGVQVVTGANVNIRVTTNAGLWTVDRVDLFVNDVRVEQRLSQGLEGVEVFDFIFNPSEAGVYNIRAQVVQIDAGSGDADNWVLTDAISVIANNPTGAIPQVSVTSPPDGSSFTSASTIPVEAVVASPESPVETVIFYAGDQEIGRDDTPPYQIPWSPGRAGSYRLSAIAVTEDGALGASAPVSTTITLATSQPPIVSLFSPRDGNTFLPSTDLLLYADARDPDGLIEQVEFFVNGVSVGASQNAPFAITWTIPSSGDFRLTAVAQDNTGNRTSSQPISISGAAPNANIPMVNISHPLALGGGDVVNDVSVGSDMFINATVNYNGPGSIEAVRFYINGALIGESEQSLGNIHSIYFKPTSVGAYLISAEAETSDGMVGQAESVMLVVAPLQSPLPKITLDSFPSAATLGDWVLLTATTDSGLLGVDRVDYFANGVLIGSSQVEASETGVQSFDFIWYPSEAGDYEFTARTVQIDAGGADSDNWVLSNSTSLTVSSPSGSDPMTVTITRPTDGSNLRVLEPITLIADAVNPNGIINRVEFYLNGQRIPVDGNPASTVFADYSYPYEAQYTPLSTGVYTFSAKVFDDRGNSAWSDSIVKIVVNGSSSPAVSIVSPAPGKKVTAGSDILIKAEASDADGSVSRVEFKVNGQFLSEDTTEPFTAFWTPASAGSYVVEATAFDNMGLRQTATRTFEVEQLKGSPPSITLALTADGNVTPGSRIIANANVIDPDGDDDVEVAFFLNGVQLDADPSQPGVQADTKWPYSTIIEPKLTFPAPYPRQYSIRAVATDSDGNSRSVELDQLFLSDFSQSLPGLIIRSPAAGETLTAGSRASLRVETSGTATDQIERVVFYANGIQIGQDDSPPYSIDWIPDQLGDVEITAAALLPLRTFAYDTRPTPHLTTSVRPVQVAAPVSVRVNPASGVLPSVSLYVLPEQPEGQTPLAQGSRVVLYANAVNNDSESPIQTVRFFVNGVEIDSVSQAPYMTHWIPSAEGTYYLNASVRDSKGNNVNSSFANLTVGNAVWQTPTINLSAPSSGQNGTPLTLRATVQGFVLPPSKVVFYANGEVIGETTELPFNLEWEPRTEGKVHIFAAAQRDMTGGGRMIGTSEVKTITLAPDSLPVVESFTSTAKDGQAYRNDTITFNVSSSDNGYIEKVEILRNGSPLSNVGVGSNITFTDTPPGVGTYRYQAVVTDNTGNPAFSDVLTINVIAGTPPAVALISPVNGFEVTANHDLTITASAYARNPGGVITGVRFYRDGVLIGQDTDGAPYSFTFRPSNPGQMSFTAVASDSNGNSAESTAVTVTVVEDKPPVVTGFSHDAPSKPLVNVPITFEIQATDDHLLQSVKLYVNGQEIASEGIPQSITYTPGAPGIYNFQARAVDNAGQSAYSEVVTLQVGRGLSPVVEITRPDADATAAQGVQVVLEANAQDPDGTIAQVVFRVNNAQIGEPLLAPPYRTTFLTTSPGAYQITAVATDNSGNTVTSAARVINVLQGSVPAIVSFTNDTVNNQSLVNVPITFTMDATDEKGVVSVTLYQDNQPVGVTTTRPFRIVVTPDSADDYLFHAVVLNQDGNTTRTENVLIDVRDPNPLSNIADFVYQTYLDLYHRPPTIEEQDQMIARMETSLPPSPSEEQLLNARAAVVVEMLGRNRIGTDREDPQSIESVRNVLVMRHILANDAQMNPWDISREDFETQVDVVRSLGLPSLLRDTYLSTYATVYGEPLPGPNASDLELDVFIRSIWHAKYGILPGDEGKQPQKLPYPTASQLSFARTMLRLMGLENFLADFVRDYGVLYSGTGSFTPLLGFQNVPNDRSPAIADAANLILGLLRPEGPVSEDEVAQLAATPQLIDQAKQVLSDPRYADRFLTPVSEAIVTGKDWKVLPWFGDGHFYDGFAPWMWHINYGWIYIPLEGQRGNGFWLWDTENGWIMTGSDFYPMIYVSEKSGWIMHDLSSNWYWDYQENAWHPFQ